MKIDDEDYESDIDDEIIEMHVDCDANALFKGKDISGH